jgi:hypothetical protein
MSDSAVSPNTSPKACGEVVKRTKSGGRSPNISCVASLKGLVFGKELNKTKKL